MITTIATPAEAVTSLAQLDQLVDRAVQLAIGCWGQTFCDITEAGLVITTMRASHALAEPAPEALNLTAWDLLECVATATREIQRWDLRLVGDFPELTQLRVLLGDAHRALTGDRVSG